MRTITLLVQTCLAAALGLHQQSGDHVEAYGRASPTANSLGGVKLALTQDFLDYATSVAKPPALDFLRNFKFPDPLKTGDDYTCSWSIGGLQLSNVDADLRLTLVAPSSLQVSISNLKVRHRHSNPRRGHVPRPPPFSPVCAACCRLRADGLRFGLWR
jgi:hypothetical protein